MLTFLYLHYIDLWSVFLKKQTHSYVFSWIFFLKKSSNIHLNSTHQHISIILIEISKKLLPAFPHFRFIPKHFITFILNLNYFAGGFLFSCLHVFLEHFFFILPKVLCVSLSLLNLTIPYSPWQFFLLICLYIPIIIQYNFSILVFTLNVILHPHLFHKFH